MGRADVLGGYRLTNAHGNVMDAMIKWIGGATTAIVLVFGGATLANELADNDPPRLEAEVVPLDEAIPVDEAVIANHSANPQMISNPQIQDVSAEMATADEKLTVRPAAKPANDRFVVKRILPIEGPIKYGEWHWDDKGVPSGPLVVTVDLDARIISVFRGGYEIGTAAVLLGTQEHPTPLGTFPILTKEKDNVSEKYDNAPMPYTLRLTWDGVAIHGSQVENGYASHGCVGTPNDFAAKLFAIAKKGDKVIITRGETLGMGDKIL